MNAARDHLVAAFLSAVKAAMPEHAVQEAVRTIPRPTGRTIVVGGGKAAAVMACALEAAWDGELEGVVVTRYGHAPRRPQRIELLEAGHPVPDAASQVAGQRMLSAVSRLSRNDLVIALLSGGASALMVAPRGVPIEEKRRISQLLLRSGADITEINTVRKHLSALKGGHLAKAAAPARVVSLIVSDVVGDDLSTIASGPTTPDPTDVQDAAQICVRYGIESSLATAHFRSGFSETPKAGEVAFEQVENRLIVTNVTALDAARAYLTGRGVAARIVSDRVTGEAREAAHTHCEWAAELWPGQALLSGGETTVTVRGAGRGGRNCEFLLALVLELGSMPGIYALACDTDGIDGMSDAAGALLTPDTLERAAALGLNAQAMLDDNDAYSFFAALGDLVVTGSTGTNVNDFRCVLRLGEVAGVP